MTRLSKYLGFHSPENYADFGQVNAWCNAFSATPDDTRGVPINMKMRDNPDYWTGGLAVPLKSSIRAMMEEAAPWGFEINIQWMPFQPHKPLVQATWDSHKHSNLMNAARAVATDWPSNVVLFFGNKQDEEVQATDKFYAEIIGEIGGIWTAMGREWGYCDDQGGAAVLDHMPELRAAWEKYGGRPKTIGWHGYGWSDWAPKHAALMMHGVHTIGGPHLKGMHQEAHIGFIGVSGTRPQFPELYNYATGNYCADMCEANDKAGAVTCLFTITDFFEIGSLTPNDPLKALVARANGTPIETEPYEQNFRQIRLKSYALRNKWMSKGAAYFLSLALG